MNENFNKLFGSANEKIVSFALIFGENPLNMSALSEEEFKEKYICYSCEKFKRHSSLAEEKRKLSASHIKDRILKTGEAGLRIGSFIHMPVNSRYTGGKLTYIIFNLALSDGFNLAKNFGQESFVFAKRNGAEFILTEYISKNICTAYSLHKSAVVKSENDFENSFPFSKGENLRESIIESQVVESLIPYVDSPKFKEYFNDSINENATFMHRAGARRRYISLYSNKKN